MLITSRSNPKIKELIKLADKKYRKQSGLYIVEGVKPVRECIAAGGDIVEIYCVESLSDEFENAILLSESVFSCVSSEKTPQGVLATVRIPQNELCPPKKSCILLDNIQDPGNLGTILRTANAAGYSEIYLINCADAYSPKAVRASMSGIFFIKAYNGSESEILGALKGVSLICADMDGSDIFDFNPPARFCLCIGNEGNGISENIINRAEYKVKIPMSESCESLNAAVSAGICMYQLKNRR